jgi:hypothetical protein
VRLELIKLNNEHGKACEIAVILWRNAFFRRTCLCVFAYQLPGSGGWREDFNV